MSCEHCETHDCDATNGCRACDRIDALEGTDWLWGYCSVDGWYVEKRDSYELIRIRGNELLTNARKNLPVCVVRAVLEHYADPPNP